MPRPHLVVGATVAALALLVGCGGSDGSDSEPNADESATSASPSDEGEGFADLSGQEIADMAEAAMLELESVAYDGELGSGEGQLLPTVQTSLDGSCTGSVGLRGGTVEVLGADGENWYRPDEAFWRANAAGDADQIIKAVGDKWVVDTKDDFSGFCDFKGFLTDIFEDDASPSTYEVLGTEELDGQEVVRVTSTDEDGSATGYVLVEGEHYFVKIERTEGDSPAELNFSAFNEDVPAEAPAADEQIDLSTQGG